MTDAKRRFPSMFVRPAEGGNLDLQSLRAKAKADPAGFAMQVDQLLEAGELSWEKLKRAPLGLYTALKDIECECRVPDPFDGGVRNITTQALPLILGGMTLGTMRDAMPATPSVGDQLVTDIESSKPTLTIPGILLVGDAEAHKPGNPFPLVQASDERFDAGERPMGVRLQIDGKLMRQDDGGVAISRLVREFAMIPEEDREEHTLDAVTDWYQSRSSGIEPAVLHYTRAPGAGVATALYSATANNPGDRAPSGTWVQNNALTGYTALETARIRLAKMVNNRGKPAVIGVGPETIVLVPTALESLARRLFRSEKVPGQAGTNENNDWGPEGAYRPTLLPTPWLDRQSARVNSAYTGSASAWYMGRFRDQFRRKVAQQLTFASMSGPNYLEFVRAGIFLEASYQWDWSVFADAYEFVVRCTQGTTAPADE